MDLIKKKIECIKNGVKIDENDEKFYKIKKHPKIISQELDKITKGEKEGKFLLDCTNKITLNTPMRFYDIMGGRRIHTQIW